MKKFLLLPIVLGVSQALATGSHHAPKPIPAPHPVGVNTNTNSVEGNASAVADSAASAEANSASNSSASSGDSSASSTSGGNTVSNSTVYKQRRQAPDVFASAGNTTAPCQADRRIGASAGIGGLSFGSSKTVRDCVLQEAADAELFRGNLAASIKLRCNISVYKKALGEDCEALLNTQTEIKREGEDGYSKKEVDAKIENAFKAAVKK